MAVFVCRACQIMSIVDDRPRRLFLPTYSSWIKRVHRPVRTKQCRRRSWWREIGIGHNGHGRRETTTTTTTIHNYKSRAIDVRIIIESTKRRWSVRVHFGCYHHYQNRPLWLLSAFIFVRCHAKRIHRSRLQPCAFGHGVDASGRRAADNREKRSSF